MVTPNGRSLSPGAREALWQALGAAVAGDASGAAQVLLDLEASDSRQVLEMILCAYALMLVEVGDLEEDCRSAEADRDSLQVQLDAARDGFL